MTALGAEPLWRSFELLAPGVIVLVMTARKQRRRGGPAKRSPYGAAHRDTSLPTSRGAYGDTRDWLLKRHGPICAYCGRKVAARTITLDHVTPRRGQTAYDRRDNLVLCCKSCNGLKADAPILKFLLGKRERARNLLHFGDHLSPMLVAMAKDLAGPLAVGPGPFAAGPDSPYRD